MGKTKLLLTAALFISFLSGQVVNAGLFDKKKEEAKPDPFAASHSAETVKLKAAPGVHSPVAEGACSKCHASRRTRRR